jgi:hypothetical protein
MDKLLQLLTLCLAATLITLAMPACESSPFGTGDDDDVADDDVSDDDVSDDDVGDDDTAPAEAVVSGTATRIYQTCPPQGDGNGDLCTFLAEVCDDYDDVVASAMVAANMGMPETPVDFNIEFVADGVWQAFGFLDDNGTGCDAGPDEGDFFTTTGCVEVEVAGQVDVADVEIVFDAKCP